MDRMNDGGAEDGSTDSMDDVPEEERDQKNGTTSGRGADENSDKGLSDVTSDGATSSGSTATTSSGKEENPEEDYIRNHLKTYTWYHGLMFGNICDKLLKWDHSFLVRRVITKTGKFLCLSVRIASKVYHFRLRTNQHGWTCPKKLLKSNLKISKVQIIYFAMNIACGMRYIASKNVIHRDLAARNCLITKDLKAKISDFGLSRLGPQVIEKSIKKAPIRWMSPESLLTGTFNEKTDVWSYGVLLTEMMTRCAHKPLWPMGIKDAQEHIKTSDAPHRIRNGEPWELLAIVDACCDRNPETRFNFQTVKRQMRTIYTNCLAAGNQQQETNQTPIGPTSGVIPLEMKKSNDRQKTMNTTLGRKKSKDGGMIKSSKSKKSKKSKRKFFSFRRKNKNGIQLPTGMSTVPVGSPKATPTSQAPSLPTPPLNTPPLPPPQTSVTSVPSPSQNSAPPISGPPTSTQSKSPTTTQ
ncbi:Protein CBG08016 [Caenorhabditis briggsae]|uniref:Tyrosine-protein kinase n=1 Tax=Caenorhabditis briggsae TaxID=6238 RepID=A8X5L2_CAEBR|nr:Protein CBG08016 [Caenorhabditis briggsae]CAP27923.2 Protein CBG08016 [Caenorhabditis briggsae]